MSSANHLAAIVGFNLGAKVGAIVPGANSASVISARINQLSYNQGRLFPGYTTLARNGATAIRPYALAFPAASDQWGAAIPAGTLMVTQVAGIENDGSAYNDAFENYLIDPTNAGSRFVGVPAILPVGYTARTTYDWRYASQSLFRYWGATGFTTATWVPSFKPMGYLNTTGWSGSGSFPFALQYDIAGPGYRRVEWRFALQSPDRMDWGGTLDVKLSHNADGSAVAAGSVGDTIDDTRSFTNADFPTIIAPNRWSSWQVAPSGAQAAFGVPTRFYSTTYYNVTAPFVAATAYPIQIRVSPVLNVPLPISVPGVGDLIAPGGTV